MTSSSGAIRSHFGNSSNLVPTEILRGEEERDRKKYDVRIWKDGDSAVLIYELKVNSTWIQRRFPVPCWPHWSQIPQLLPYSLSSLWGWRLMTCHVHCPDGSLKLHLPRAAPNPVPSSAAFVSSQNETQKKHHPDSAELWVACSLRKPVPISRGLPSSFWPLCVAMVWLFWRWD